MLSACGGMPNYICDCCVVVEFLSVVSSCAVLVLLAVDSSVSSAVSSAGSGFLQLKSPTCTDIHIDSTMNVSPRVSDVLANATARTLPIGLLQYKRQVRHAGTIFDIQLVMCIVLTGTPPTCMSCMLVSEQYDARSAGSSVCSMMVSAEGVRMTHSTSYCLSFSCWSR